MQASSYSSTLSCFNQIIRTDGYYGLYKGGSIIVTTNSIRSSINIALYTSLKHKLNYKNHFLKGFIPGCITGTLFTLLACPLERIKCIMQTPNIYKSSYECIAELYKKEKLAGMFRGFVITGIRDFIGFGVFFGTYEAIKGKIHDNH